MMLLRSLALSAALLLCGTAYASWDDVQKLDKNSTVRVSETGGKTQSGNFAGLNPTSLLIIRKGAEVSIPRDTIRRIEVKSSGRRLRNSLIGAGIGLAVGVVLDQTLGAYLRNETNQTAGARAATVLLPTALFGGIGAAIPGYRTIYKSPGKK